MTAQQAPPGGMIHDVAALARLDRRTTGPGEHRSAELIAARLTEAGAKTVEITGFRSQSSWAPTHLAHLIAAVTASFLPGPLKRSAAVATAVSYELDVSGRSHWLRRLLPAGRGVSVSARLPSLGPPRRTIVLLAHHDAAHNGLVWHPKAIAPNRFRSRRTGRSVPSHAPALLAILATALSHPGTRRPLRLVLSALGVAMIQSMRSPTTPGANDNATGVAAVLELTRRLRATPLTETEVIVLFPGGEEAGNVGMRAWTERQLRFDPARTLAIGLDSLGSGGHLVVARREGLTGRMSDRDIAAAQRIAAQAGIELPAVTFANVCDTTIARHAGMRAISLLSYDRGWIRHLHLRSDTPDAVGWNTVTAAVELTARLAHAWDRGEID
ncbi:M28 family metallopeptidase [Nocardia pseudobrasiliensis]|uniref:3-hydroxy-3-methylglutaryl-coenzyme A reductase n=1 Tax=Nocardia pseudobrasiliensis TaxID=45979 RepID=A0A370IB83_9NOCA|nr:M28 family peptidase [Nocardia pseudobrasiliensis]RDI67995.1 3-hydroxy-3-methylglutaryl-coenzyme A reductase [Nocardia pseudobrasiliensis]